MTLHGSWTLDRLVEAYTQHQRRTRGLRPQTLRGRARLVRMLVQTSLGEDPVEPARLAPADVWRSSPRCEAGSRLGRCGRYGRLCGRSSGSCASSVSDAEDALADQVRERVPNLLRRALVAQAPGERLD